MIRRKKMISIKTKLLLLMLVLVIIPLVIMFFNSFYSSQQLLERKYTELLQELSAQLNMRVEEFLEETKKISLVTSYGINSYISVVDQGISPVHNYLLNDTKQNENQAIQLLLNYIRLKNDIFSIYVYNLNGGNDLLNSTKNTINYDYNPRDEAWFQQFLASDDIMRNTSSLIDKQIKEENHWAILHLRKIFDMNNGKLLGVMVISIDIDFIHRLNNSVNKANALTYTIVDNNQQIVYANQTQWIKQPINDLLPLDDEFVHSKNQNTIIHIDGKQQIIVSTPLESLNWTSFIYMPVDEMVLEGKWFIKNAIILAIGLLLFSIISSVYLTSIITRPIKRLMSNIVLVEKGKFDNLAKVNSNDEIGILALRFEQMSSELKQLVERIYQEEQEKKEAEIRALQAQINPHFLYNTLNSVKWIASMQRSDKIVEMTEALIGLLRYSSQTSSPLVRLEEELKSIDNYLAIQKVRYFNKFDVYYDVNEQLLDVLIPKLVLQPMVENAIFHGLADVDYEGFIEIKVSENEKGDVQITIADNGRGMDEITAQRLEEKLMSVQTSDDHIGVKNVHSRIQHYYGHRYGLSFKSELGKGSQFTIIIPKNR